MANEEIKLSKDVTVMVSEETEPHFTTFAFLLTRWREAEQVQDSVKVTVRLGSLGSSQLREQIAAARLEAAALLEAAAVRLRSEG